MASAKAAIVFSDGSGRKINGWVCPRGQMLSTESRCVGLSRSYPTTTVVVQTSAERPVWTAQKFDFHIITLERKVPLPAGPMNEKGLLIAWGVDTWSEQAIDTYFGALRSLNPSNILMVWFYDLHGEKEAAAYADDLERLVPSAVRDLAHIEKVPVFELEQTLTRFVHGPVPPPYRSDSVAHDGDIRTFFPRPHGAHK